LRKWFPKASAFGGSGQSPALLARRLEVVHAGPAWADEACALAFRGRTAFLASMQTTMVPGVPGPTPPLQGTPAGTEQDGAARTGSAAEAPQVRREAGAPVRRSGPGGRRITRLAMGAALSLAGLGATALLVVHVRDAAVPAPPPAPAVPVVAVPVQQRDVPIVLGGLGTVQALNAATIRSQVTGMLQSVDFVEGQQVHRGDTLARIDPRPFQARLTQAEAQLGHDQAQIANVQLNLGRNLPLLSRGFATAQQVADQQSQITQLQATAQSDQAAIDDARTQLGYATLVAPFDGITGVRGIDVGNIIHPADSGGLVSVAQVQPIAVMVTLPSAAIPQVQDALARGAVPAVAYDQSGTGVLDIGQLLVVNNQADPQSGTVQLKALFPNLARRLWPGTFVNVELTTSVAKAALVVPTDAVQQGVDGEFVFVIGADHTVAPSPVQVGQRLRGEAMIAKGLSAGQSVVAQGQYRLAAGTAVVAADPGQVANSSTATSGMLP